MLEHEFRKGFADRKKNRFLATNLGFEVTRV